jgi:hypothetical protein
MRRRLLTLAAVAAAISIPVSTATVVVGGSNAFAASSISCASLKGTDTGTVTIGKCTPSGGKGYKDATGSAATLATGGNITWSKSGATTTIGDTNATEVTNTGCSKKDSEYEFTGSVTGASTSGTGIPKVGDAVQAYACLASSGKVSLAKGTDALL